MNPVLWLQMTNMISYQGLVRTFPNEHFAKIVGPMITYTDSSGAASSPTAVKLGGDDGKTEVVDIDGKTYDSADLNGGNLQTGLTAGGERW